jgi:hypothetical protein
MSAKKYYMQLIDIYLHLVDDFTKNVRLSKQTNLYIARVRACVKLNTIMRINYTLEMRARDFSFLRKRFLKNFIAIAVFFFSAAASAQCPTPPGTPTSYPTDVWRGYVYSGLDTNNPPLNAFTSTYRGYFDTPGDTFDYDLGAGAFTGSNICGTYTDSFSVRFRMQKNFAAGYYTFTIGGDDGVRLSVDGGSTFTLTDWNYHSYETVTQTIYLSGTTNLVLEYYDQGGQSRVSLVYGSCGTTSTAPTGISGTTTICDGNGTTLSATGGTMGSNGAYQWGTGTTVGNNIISGATSASIAVTPTATTTYWVRRVDAAPCSLTTTGVTQQVTVNPVSTAPTALSGATTICQGNSVTLTASGGTLASGAVYEWGKGSAVGTNPIAGQTGASISVTPASTTTYWVRRVNANSCGTTTGLTATVTVTQPDGDEVTYGTDSWIGYAYASIDSSNPPTNTFTTSYRGYLTQPDTFDMNLGATALSGANICGTYATNFSIRFKMNKVLAAGYYTFTAGGDDGYRLSIDGGATWIITNWVDHGYTTSTTTSLYLSGSTNFILEFYERAGVAEVSFSYTSCTSYSSAPTGISGTTSICNGSSTVLTATGGTSGAIGSYQWGTGTTVGSNIISGQTATSIIVSPTTNTTYWVRRTDTSPCNLTTPGVTQLVTVAPKSTAPTGISGTLSSCGGSTTLTATGGTLAAGGAYEWGTGSIVGSNIIASANAISLVVTPTVTTAYWVRRTDLAPCSTPTTGYSVTVTVNPASTAPTSISGSPSLCSLYGVTLSALGGTEASGAIYQWGTGSVVGTNPIAGSNSTLYVSPTATTTYWVRRYDASCSTYTTGVTVVVTKISVAPTGISGAGYICPGANTVLTANGATLGTGSTYQWGTGSVVGTNPISGSTAATLTVNPTVATTYWVRCLDLGSCPATAGVTFTVNINSLSTAPTSISGSPSLCNLYGVTLSALGGTEASGAIYQWGTGSVVGTNAIAGSNSTLYVNPSATTTYWVRRYDAACSTYTTGVTVVVTKISIAPTSITGSSSICVGTSTTLTANGATLGTGSTYQWGTGSVVGTNPISGSTAATLSVNPTVATTYWVRCLDLGSCPATSGVTFTVSVNALSTAPISISGSPSLCSLSGTTLTANGGTEASGAIYQWGTGSVAGTNPIAGTLSSLWVNPSATTTYWVRRYDSACNSYTTGVTAVVTKTSAAPSGITGASTICAGVSTVLTANGATLGTGSTYQWGTGSVVGTNPISGSTASTLTVNPAVATTYWVRCLDLGSCPATSGVTFTVNITALSTAPTSISGSPSLCSTYGVNLTASGGTEATGATYQWGTGSVVGTNPIAGNSNILWVNPTATTIYWVRRLDACGSYTSGITTTVYKGSTGPWSITGTSPACSGAATILTASGGTPGTGSLYQWGTGSTEGLNIISGQTNATISVTPTATTAYWVRLVDLGPCGATAAVFFTLTVSDSSTAPTSISGTSPVCSGSSTILTATGATLASGGAYQWGTGSSVGTSPISGQTASTLTISPTATTTYWVRSYDSGCAHYTSGVTFTVNVKTPSTAPTSISGTSTICNGSSTTLTSSGGTSATGAVYQWGTGNIVGANIISGSTASISASPTVTTMYWVRRVDVAPCSTFTAGATVTVTVVDASTAPTAISGGPSASTCAGTTFTLTATGGTLATGANYQWGTGTTVGSNIISGQTAASITVSPTATTTYWVRRHDGTPCSGYSSGITTTITIITPPGTPSVFGSSQWIAYGYSTGDISLATAIYAGYYTQSTLGIDTQTGTNSWNSGLSPSSSAGWTGSCTIPVDNFTVSYKRKGFPCGMYSLTLQNWDDEARIFIDGTLVWSCDSWSGGSTCSGAVGSFNLTATSEVEVRFREYGGNANIKLDLVKTDVAATAPTAITGNFSLCLGSTTTLTATGGTLGTNGSYQWGTGLTVGSNIIAGETGVSISVNPLLSTVYWVRRVDGLCGTTTAGVTQLITLVQNVVAGTLNIGNSVICHGTLPGNITLTGNTGTVIKWQSADNFAFTSNVTNIASTSTILTGNLIGSLNSTKYFRAFIQNGNCFEAYTTPIVITVPAAVTFNGTWSSTPTALTPIIVSANLTLSSNMNVCSCQLTNNAIMNIPANKSLVVTREITVTDGANIIVENNGSIVQIDDNAVNSGAILVKRNTEPLKAYDFNYWSSPVKNLTMHDLSPLTLSDKYFSYDPLIGNWVTSLNGAAVMNPGQGYIIRAPQGWSTTNGSVGVYPGQLHGVPNSGVLPVSINKGLDTYNLIGNPYPCAIDIDQFLTDPDNDPVVNGTVYLWTHNTAVAPSGGLYVYCSDDYAKYNLTGGVQTMATAITGGAEPTGKIASGQGFFIEANSALAAGNYTANFKNAMRVIDNNSQYFRTANVETDSENSALPALEKDRIWLHLTNASGAYCETLVGYVTGATNGMDSKFDGPTMSAGTYVDFYSVLDTNKLSIQGKALPFDQADVVPMGYVSTIAGSFNIGLEHFDGLFDAQDVYLVDKTDNSYHNLKLGEYTFTTASGTFQDRFELRFMGPNLGTHPVAGENSVYIIKHDKHIEVSTGNYEMKSVTIFDLTGKRIYTADDINATLFSTYDLNIAAQVLIVKVTLDDNQVITKKVMVY